jgi:uncharacterized protein (DUF58 family)
MPANTANVINEGAQVTLAGLIALRQEAGRLQLAPRGKVLATRSGGHLSRFRGRGMEFDESRVYQPGDDPRNMDWRVTARSTQPHVKLFREERERPVWFLVDSRPAMHFGTRVAFKSVIAAKATALLAWAAADKGDRVGGLVFDEADYVERRPAARLRGLLPLLNVLAGFASDPAQRTSVGEGGGMPASPLRLPGSPRASSLSAAAGRLAQQVRPGSMVFLVSDFAGLGEQDGAWLARLAAGSELVLLHVHDLLETGAPPAGRYPVTDGANRALLDTANAALRHSWSQRFADRVALLESLCRRYQAHLIGLRTDLPVGETLGRELRPRRARPGGIR